MNFIVNVIALKSYYLIPSLSFTSRNLIVIKKGKLIGVAILYCIDYDIVQLLNLFSQSLNLVAEPRFVVLEERKLVLKNCS